MAEKFKQIQIDVDIPINMDLPSKKVGKRCFPSKFLIYENMKYRHFFLNKWNRQEYYQHLLMAEHESMEDSASMMASAMYTSKSERIMIWRAAREFIQEEKNYNFQTKHMYNIIDGKCL